MLMDLSFDEFYAIVKKNPAAVQAGIMAAAGVPGIIAYNCLSSGAQKNLWRNVYSALK